MYAYQVAYLYAVVLLLSQINISEKAVPPPPLAAKHPIYTLCRKLHSLQCTLRRERFRVSRRGDTVAKANTHEFRVASQEREARDAVEFL